VIAGPTVAGTLARFGAEVIKLDPVRPTLDPSCTVLFYLQSGRGKRSALIDITTTRGRQVLEQLIKRADVVTINATAQQLTDLELGAASVAELNPNAVLCQVDAWSGPNGGPWRNRHGYDDLIQAATGIRVRFGGGPQRPRANARQSPIGWGSDGPVGLALWACAYIMRVDRA
jgi:crotonobetainyl-CoA:carnitine CoA-transferase CaiB-like acyl-CoA transferase